MIPRSYRFIWKPKWWRGTEYQCAHKVNIGTRYERRCFNYAATCPQHAESKLKKCGDCSRPKPRVTVASQVMAYLQIRRSQGWR